MLIAAVLLAQAATAAAPSAPDPRRYLLIKTDKPAGPVVNSVAPVFPAKLLDAVQVTTVVVEALVDQHGRIVRARIVEGDPRAHEAALGAAVQWLFEPPASDASARTIVLSFTFRTVPTETADADLAATSPDKYAVEVRARVATPRQKPEKSDR